MAEMVNIGFGNLVNTDRIVAIINSDSAPAKRIVQNAKEHNQLIDATQGRRTKSIIITDTGQIVISSLQPDTLSSRFTPGR
jgi:regulator of extracellular matrix RemA (YlzA/DUF370 family)